MSEQNKPDYTYIWSSGGSVVAPSSVKIQTGWTAEVPPFQWENWSQNRQDQAIAHILQKGISVWSATGEYYFTASGERSYVQGSDGLIYVALQDSVNQNPISATAYWQPAFPTTGRLLRTSIYRNSAGVLQVSINGAAFATASSTFTPLPLTVAVMAEVLGAGGGGGGATATGVANTSAGAGGGGGGYAKGLFTTGFNGATVSVGLGGAVTANAAGSSGGSSAFGALLVGAGGGGGSLGTSQTNTITVPVGQGGGGVGSGGFLSCVGGTGSYALYGPNTISGAGGASVFGDGAQWVSGTSGGANAITPGSGGSGGVQAPSIGSSAAGGLGANGLVIVQEFS